MVVSLLFILNGLEVCSAVIAGGRKDHGDAMHCHTHSSQHRAHAVVHRSRLTHSHLRLKGMELMKLTFYLLCFLPVETKICTYSPSKTHSKTQEVSIIYNVVVGKSGPLRIPSGPLKHTNNDFNSVDVASEFIVQMVQD